MEYADKLKDVEAALSAKRLAAEEAVARAKRRSEERLLTTMTCKEIYNEIKSMEKVS